MFYEKQDVERKESYLNMLKILGELSKLFNDGSKPFLYYRCHENMFCKYFDAENLSREDCSIDAKKGDIGIGLKTWINSDLQKIAEFNKLRPRYENLRGLELCKEISKLRNRRVQFTMDSHGLKEIYYHIIKREIGRMNIYEHSFDMIDISNIKLLDHCKNDKNPKFTDGKHIYSFNWAKSTLFMYFDKLVYFGSVDIDITYDPFEYLENIKSEGVNFAYFIDNKKNDEQICLRLYGTKPNGEKYIFEKSGLNQWNAGGRKRNPDEAYIPYNKEDKNRKPDFFPPRDTSFELLLPNGKTISAKVCQDGGKAIMSNPNSDLGHWLLRDLFKLKEWQILTLKTLEDCDIDSVIFTKIDYLKYKIEFAPIGTYERMYYEDK